MGLPVGARGVSPRSIADPLEAAIQEDATDDGEIGIITATGAADHLDDIEEGSV